mgnify:CR=1
MATQLQRPVREQTLTIPSQLGGNGEGLLPNGTLELGSHLLELGQVRSDLDVDS